MKKKHTKYRVSHRFDPTLTPCTFLNYQTLENVSQVVFLQHMCSSRLCYNFGQISFWFYIICNSLLKNMYFTVSRLVLCILFLHIWLTRKTILQPVPDWSIKNSISQPFKTHHLAQYAEARCYPKKRCLTKLFKFKKFSIKQAFFINDISSSQVKAHKQKKNWSFFVLILPFFPFFF